MAQEYLYRLASGRFVAIREREHREGGRETPRVKRLSDEDAAAWLLFGYFEPPADIANLAEQHRFKDQLPPRNDEHGDTPSDVDAPMIRWNKDTCTLTVNGTVARKVRGLSVAKNVATVLDCFEGDGWPQRIDSPFTSDESGKQTCRETIRSLNEGLLLIRFKADGSGEGILWEFISRAPPQDPETPF